MKRSSLISYIFLLISTIGFAQLEEVKEVPDYNAIKTEIEKKNSDSYYPKLLSRFREYDNTLTLKDYRNLYYGYVLQKNFDPYYVNPNEEKLQKYYSSDELNQKDYESFIRLANASLKENPFDLRILNFLAYVYHLKGDDDMAKKISNNFQNILQTIFSTGDGLQCETAFHVISVSHEYVLLNMLQLERDSQSLIGDCDYLAFEKGKYGVDGLYFNISKLYGNKIPK